MASGRPACEGEGHVMRLDKDGGRAVQKVRVTMAEEAAAHRARWGGWIWRRSIWTDHTLGVFLNDFFTLSMIQHYSSSYKCM